MSPSWVRVALTPMAAVLVGDRRGDTDTEEKPREDRGRGEEDGPTSPGTPGAPEAGRGRKDRLLEPLEGLWSCPLGSQWSCPAWISDFWPPELGYNSFLFFEASHFVKGATKKLIEPIHNNCRQMQTCKLKKITFSVTYIDLPAVYSSIL